MRKKKKSKRVKCQVIPKLTPQDRTIADLYEGGISKRAIIHALRIKESHYKNTLKRPEVKKYLEKIRIDTRKRCHRMMDNMARMLEKRIKAGKITETTYEYDEKGRRVREVKKEAYSPRDLAEMAKLAGMYTPSIALNQNIIDVSANEVEIGERLLQQSKLLKGA